MKHILLILVGGAFAAAHAAQPPALVTGGMTNVAGASDSFIQGITPDGRRAVIVSHANNLTTNDDLRTHSDIFVRDSHAGVTFLVTVSTNGSGGGNGNSQYASISADGRFVIFASDASNLISNDTNGVSDVFRRDLQAGITELVSVARSGGVASASGSRSTSGASKPAATPDGRWVAFESASTELVDGDTNLTPKIFVRDMQAGVTRLATAGAQYSRLGSITPDGRFVAFVAQTALSMPGRTNTGGDIFVADLQTGQQFWASTDLPSPLLSGYKCLPPVVTGDGRAVIFKVTTSSTYLLQYDLTTEETTLVTAATHPSTPLALSADGRWLAFEDGYAIYLRDRQNGTNQLVSYGWGPVMTPDARHVAFTGGDYQIHVHDVIAGTTRRATHTTNGTSIKMSAAAQLLITADGQTVLFDTDAADVVANDNNGAHDVFRHDLRTGVTDLVSGADASRPSRSAMRSATFNHDMVDATAQRIAFVSPDMPGIPGDTNTFTDVFVRDIATGALHTLPTQHDYGATNFPSDSKALDPQISADGVGLIFVRERLTNGVTMGSDLMWHIIGGDPPWVVTNLGDAPPAISSNGQAIVYQQRPSSFYTWHEPATGLKMSIASAFYEPDPQLRVRPVVSGDGRWLAFRNSDGGVVVYSVSNSLAFYDRTFGNLSLSRGGDLVLSADSQFLFVEGSPPYTVYRRDLQNRQTDLICTNCMNPSPSANGNAVAYNLALNGGPKDIVVHDLPSGVKKVITTEFAPTNAPCATLALLRSARMVVMWYSAQLSRTR